MIESSRELLEAFDRLPEAERFAFAIEILRRTTDGSPAAPSDDDLTLAAEELFLHLDAEESLDART